MKRVMPYSVSVLWHAPACPEHGDLLMSAGRSMSTELPTNPALVKPSWFAQIAHAHVG